MPVTIQRSMAKLTGPFSFRSDGDPEYRSSGYQAVRLVQGQGGEESAHADRCRLRSNARWRSLRVHFLSDLMVILNIDHPDIKQFVWCKAKEEKKAHTLIDAGYDPTLDGEAYGSIFFQNANNSVRVTDEFMEAVAAGGDWWTRSVANGQPKERHSAKDLLREIAEATHQCGDPGMQYDTTINRWHTSKATARINASNPCSEYMFLDDSACNLASLNLMKFVGPDGKFDVEAFRHACDTVTLAQEIIVDSASYPTEKIARNSHN